jgi:hypothetical protein
MLVWVIWSSILEHQNTEMTKCPTCENTDLSRYFDGGSFGCNKCNNMFHKCADGTLKISRQGPLSCEACKAARGFHCRCGYVNPKQPRIKANDGGNSMCEKCKVPYHICCGKVRYGSPGPTFCEHCQPKQISQSPQRYAMRDYMNNM